MSYPISCANSVLPNKEWPSPPTVRFLRNILRIYGNSIQIMVSYGASVPRNQAIVYCPTSIECAMRHSKTKTPAKPPKTRRSTIVYSPTRGGVLPNKRWCTPLQEIVYSPTNFGVLPNKEWCTAQQVLVYSPTSRETHFSCKAWLF